MAFCGFPVKGISQSACIYHVYFISGNIHHVAVAVHVCDCQLWTPLQQQWPCRGSRNLNLHLPMHVLLYEKNLMVN